MNANQLINVAMRLFARKAMSKGLDAGMRRMSSGSGPETRDANKAAQQTKSQTRNLDQVMKVTRRLMRF